MKRFLVDGHCDTITKAMDRGEQLIKNSCQLDIQRLNQFEFPVQFFAIWLEQSYYLNAFEKTLEYIKFYKSQIQKYSTYIAETKSFEDILKNRENKKISAIVSIEGGESIENNIELLNRLHDLGVRAMSLTWNFDNQLAGGSLNDNGMTEFGYEVVDRMESLNMIVDVSHMSQKSFWDFNSVAKRPYMASHSNSKSVCNHSRNLSDEQLKAIANRGGIVGINMYSEFLSYNKIVTIDDILKHIEHIANVAGYECICFGCDFDGIKSTPENISDIVDIYTVIEAISQKYGYDIAEKISNRNFIRFLKENLN